jgi:hypothetical protein
MPKGLDGRSRDENGQIREKRSDTTVGALRETYGAGFAPGVRSDAKLKTVLQRSGQPTLRQYIKNGKGR